MEVFYIPPPTPVLPPPDEICRSEIASARSSRHSDLPSVHGSTHASIHGSCHGSIHSSTPQSEEDNALEDIERNIASFERSLQNKEVTIDIESGDESRTRKLKIVGKRFLR